MKKTLKKTAKKTAAKTARPVRTWNQSYQFVKALKLEPSKDTVKGAIYAAIRSLKTGNADEVTAAAEKNGLGTLTKQNTRQTTMIVLRQFAEDGAVKIVRSDATPAAAPVKKAAGKKTKKVVLRKSADSGASANA